MVHNQVNFELDLLVRNVLSNSPRCLPLQYPWATANTRTHAGRTVFHGSHQSDLTFKENPVWLGWFRTLRGHPWLLTLEIEVLSCLPSRLFASGRREVFWIWLCSSWDYRKLESWLFMEIHYQYFCALRQSALISQTLITIMENPVDAFSPQCPVSQYV